jgi:hypothetical protein
MLACWFLTQLCGMHNENCPMLLLCGLTVWLIFSAAVYRCCGVCVATVTLELGQSTGPGASSAAAGMASRTMTAPATLRSLAGTASPTLAVMTSTVRRCARPAVSLRCTSAWWSYVSGGLMRRRLVLRWARRWRASARSASCWARRRGCWSRPWRQSTRCAAARCIGVQLLFARLYHS